MHASRPCTHPCEGEGSCNTALVVNHLQVGRMYPPGVVMGEGRGAAVTGAEGWMVVLVMEGRQCWGRRGGDGELGNRLVE